MINILIVEDNDSKSKEIIKAILSDKRMSESNITTTNNAIGAKRKLSKKRYDLLILDMNIPKSFDVDPSPSEGLAVLSFIKTNQKAIRPDFVVGLTEFEGEFTEAEKHFNSLVFKLLRYSEENMLWKEQLVNAVQYLADKDAPPYFNDGHTYHTDICVICALEEELDSVLNQYEGWENVSIVGDNTTYKKTSLEVGGRSISIVAAACPKMGMPIASAISTKMITSFRPRLLAMTGICAGVRGKANYGDVLIADPIFDWGGGKWVSSGEGEDIRFRPAPYPWRLDEDLLSKAKSISDEQLLSVYSSYDKNKPDVKLKAHFDAMASGGSVLQANRLMEDVREQHKNLIGIEMESYGVFTAVNYASKPKPKCISIKSVCDFGDEDKDDEFHQYASYTSAAYLALLIDIVFVEEDEW